MECGKGDWIASPLSALHYIKLCHSRLKRDFLLYVEIETDSINALTQSYNSVTTACLEPLAVFVVDIHSIFKHSSLL